MTILSRTQRGAIVGSNQAPDRNGKRFSDALEDP